MGILRGWPLGARMRLVEERAVRLAMLAAGVRLGLAAAAVGWEQGGVAHSGECWVDAVMRSGGEMRQIQKKSRRGQQGRGAAGCQQLPPQPQAPARCSCTGHPPARPAAPTCCDHRAGTGRRARRAATADRSAQHTRPRGAAQLLLWLLHGDVDVDGRAARVCGLVGRGRRHLLGRHRHHEVALCSGGAWWGG